MIYYYCPHCGFEATFKDEKEARAELGERKIGVSNTNIPIFEIICKKCSSGDIACADSHNNSDLDDETKKFFRDVINNCYKRARLQESI